MSTRSFSLISVLGVVIMLTGCSSDESGSAPSGGAAGSAAGGAAGSPVAGGAGGAVQGGAGGAVQGGAGGAVQGGDAGMGGEGGAAPARITGQAAKTAVPITIDGVRDDAWDQATPHPITNVLTENDETSTMSGNWRALWSNQMLYVYVEVVDPKPENFSLVDSYKDDGVEVYIDLNKAKGISNDGDDVSIRQRYDDPVITTYFRVISGIAGGQSTTVDGEAKPTGYVMEFGIPWNVLGAVPSWACGGDPQCISIADGLTIGWEVHINSDNNGDFGDRGKLAWAATPDEGDNAWRDPSVLGNLVLAP